MHRTEGENFIKDSEGRQIYTNGPPATTIGAAALNSIQEEICHVIEQSGQDVLTQATDTHDQLWTAISQATSSFEYIVSSQSTFNDLFERTGANTYQIKTEYSSVFIKQIIGGYACYGAGSFLSGGDTWGQIQTNNCKLIVCEGGTILQLGDQPSYLNINTQDFIGYDLRCDGLGIAAAAINYTFYINNSGVKLINPTTFNRKSNTNFTVFYSNVTNSTNYYINPIVNTCDTSGGTIKAFYQCYNIDNPYVTLLESSSGITTVFDSCKRINNYNIYNCTNSAEDIRAFNSCENIGGGIIDTLQHDGAVAAKDAIVFNSCESINDRNLKISSVSTDGAGGTAPIYNSCTHRSRQIHTITKTADYTITANDDFDELIASCNTGGNEGLRTITLLTGSESNGQKQTIRHGDNQGLIKVVTQGGNKIRFKNEEIDYVLLYMQGQYAEYCWNSIDSVYDITSYFINMPKNYDNRSDWTNVHMGNGVTYDNKSAAVDLTGMVITEATSGFTGIVVEDTQGAASGAGGILYVYALSTGFTFWTNNRQLTASDGTTCDVDEGSGSSKNIDYDLYHGFGIDIKKIIQKLIISTDGTENNSFMMQHVSLASGNYGIAMYQTDTYQYTNQVASNGFTYPLDAGGTQGTVDTEDWYNNLILIF